MSTEIGPALSTRAVRLATALEGWERRTVRLEELWDLWSQVEPVSAASGTRRTDLSATLVELSAAGLVRLSRTREAGVAPALPTELTLPAVAATPSANQLARATVWRPELAFASLGGLTLGQVEALRKINVWLRDHGRDTDVLPLRERSLQVLGYEKALERLTSTAVFGPGRLTLGSFRTFRAHPPLAATQVGEGPVVLVVENADTFHSLRSVLIGDPGPVGHVVWGAGGAFEASVRSAGDLPGAQVVRYFGDLDIDGLRIPTSAARTAHLECGVLPVAPATGLYRALLATGVRQGGQPACEPARAGQVTAWLEAPELVSSAQALLVEGFRVPQEAVTGVFLATDRAWRSGLGARGAGRGTVGEG